MKFKYFLIYFLLNFPIFTEGSAIKECPVFPEDNIWNQRVDSLPVHSKSQNYIQSIGAQKKLKPDFGSGLWEGGIIGIPFQTLEETTKVKNHSVLFEYKEESDLGPYPIPENPLIEGGPNSKGDRHFIIIDTKTCKLYEIYNLYPNGNSWKAGSGAIFDLKSNQLRPDGWTSADAAGLPIFPGLVKYDEIKSGEIKHAIRFTIRKSQKKYVWPGRHFASKNKDENLPPMGQRFRLKKTVKLEGFSKEIQVLLKALQTYGMIVADNGSDWFISGSPDERWDNDMLNKELKKIKGEDFEAVDVTPLMKDKNSGAVTK